jgi:hypothetical protein
MKKSNAQSLRKTFAILSCILALCTAVLTACTMTNNPTPQAPLAEVVTVERPSAPATPKTI